MANLTVTHPSALRSQSDASMITLPPGDTNIAGGNVHCNSDANVTGVLNSKSFSAVHYAVGETLRFWVHNVNFTACIKHCVTAQIIKLFEPFTMSPVMIVRISEPSSRSPLPQACS
jgi:hypothetical protein